MVSQKENWFIISYQIKKSFDRKIITLNLGS